MTGRDRETIERLMSILERMQLGDYVEYVSNRRRMIVNNIIYGICRGFGFTLGFSVLGAVIIVLMRMVVIENMPLIGGFVAEVIRAIEARI
jgi:hypothetical protein